MIRRIPRVAQRDGSDCGAACLASIAAWYRLLVPIARVRQFAHTDTRGTTALGIVRAASRLGFSAKGVRASRDALSALPLPAIAHVVRGSAQHWVVLSRVRETRVEIMDPAGGERRSLRRAEFESEWSGVLVLLVPATHFVTADRRTSVARRFWSLVAPHRGILASALVGAAVYTVLGLATTVYVQHLVDHVLVDGNRNLLNLMSVAMVAVILAQTLVGGMKGLLVLHTGQRIDAHLILGYHTHLLALPQRFFDTMRIGEITSRVGDAVKIRALINEVALELILSTLVVAFSLALLLLYSSTLAGIVFTIIPLYAAIWVMANGRQRRSSRDLMERGAELQSQLVESVSAIGTIKRFGLERTIELRTEARFVRLLRAVYRTSRIALFTSTATTLVSRLSIVIVLWAGSVLVIDRRLTPGELMSCHALLGYLTGPITVLISANRMIQDALIAADRLFEIMDLERERCPTGVMMSAVPDGDVLLEGVTFRYGTRAPALRDVTLAIPKGSVTAIVGESGSGKSTIAALIQRVHSPDEGRVRIAGIDLRYVTDEAMRALVCTVPQRIDLLSGTVLQNIILGDEEPDMTRVLRALHEAGMTAVIDRMPAGLDTEVGENGVTLSGGERQRLAIARALYRDPDILVLDEATSSLDVSGVVRIQQTIRERHAGGRTVIVIAHHLDMVADADHIVVMRGGVVVEEGTHADLVGRRGAYHSMLESASAKRVA